MNNNPKNACHTEIHTRTTWSSLGRRVRVGVVSSGPAASRMNSELRDVLTSHTYRPPRRRIHGIQDIPGAPSQRVCGERGWHGGDRRPSPRRAPGPEGAYGRRYLPDRAHRSRHVGSGVTPSDGEAGEGLHQRRGAVSLPRSPGRLGVHPGRVLVSGHLRRAGVHRGDGVGV